MQREATQSIKLPAQKVRSNSIDAIGARAFVVRRRGIASEANSIKQDYAAIVSVDYPNLKTLDSICQITPDRLAEHSKALRTFQERWPCCKGYADRLQCTNSVEDSLRNLNWRTCAMG